MTMKQLRMLLDMNLTHKDSRTFLSHNIITLVTRSTHTDH